MKILSFRDLAKLVPKLQFSGGMTRWYEVIDKWAKLGNEVHVVVSDYSSNIMNQSGLRVIKHLYKPLPYHKGLGIFLNAKKIVRGIPAKQFDFIYCPSEDFEFVLTSILIKKKLKVPLVTVVHSFEPYRTRSLLKGRSPRSLINGLIKILLLYLRDLFLAKSDVIFSVSREYENGLRKIGIDKHRIHIVGCGINQNTVKSAKPKGAIYDCCFLGLLQPGKGIEDLLIALKRISQKKPNVKALILGNFINMKFGERIKALIYKLNLQNNIVMPGFVIGEEKYKFLKESKTFVFPSYCESFGIAVLEAMACGLPVVAYNLPSLKEWFNNDLTYVKKGDIEGLTHAILELLEDDTLRKRMGKKGLERAKQYDWENVAKRELEVITTKLLK